MEALGFRIEEERSLMNTTLRLVGRKNSSVLINISRTTALSRGEKHVPLYEEKKKEEEKRRLRDLKSCRGDDEEEELPYMTSKDGRSSAL
jgi:hypothetical protein